MDCGAGAAAYRLLALAAPVLVAASIVVLAPRLANWPALERAETALAVRIVRWHRPRTLALFGDFSALGSSTLIALAATTAALAFALRDAWPSALAVALAPAVAGPLGTLLKRLTNRTRPHEPVALYFGSSMPSNHTLMASALYGTLALELLARLPAGDAWRSLAVAFALLVALTVGASRVLLRVHHPSDVVAAYALGAAVIGAVAAWRC